MVEMTREEFEESVYNDPDNRRGGRNRRNTPTSAYNCGGFALGVFDWVTPYYRTDLDYSPEYPEGAYTDSERECLMAALKDDCWEESDIEEEILRRDVDFLLNRYPFLDEVNLEDCDEKETVIAYRIFIRWDDEYYVLEDTDFHFKVRINGYWFEKMGTENITKCDLNPNRPWQYRDDYTQYTSSIVYFTIRGTTK